MSTDPLIKRLKDHLFVQKILKEQGSVYLVGGCVRDQFLNRPIKDLDLIVCGLAQDKLIALLKTCGRTNLVGKAFGVIKFIPKEEAELEIDIALPRKEISTGSGHKDFKVEFDANISITDDLKRRDFTINAIAQNLADNELIDPFGGRLDIQNKIIRTVFTNSFVEDPLRLLRAIQFAARFGFDIEPTTYDQIKQHAKLINTVSKERIILEVKKLFEASKPSLGFDLMRDTGLLSFVFPDVAQSIGVIQPKKQNEDVYSHTMKVLDAARSAEELDKPGNLDIMFSALFHDMGKPKTRREENNTVTFYNHQHISTGIAWRWMKEHRATTIRR